VYGAMINTVVNFLIVAFALFMLIKAMNASKRQQAAPAAPPEPSKEEVLLTQIRDLLARR
jgi:large conductance mechanosensitive channel